MSNKICIISCVLFFYMYAQMLKVLTYIVYAINI